MRMFWLSVLFEKFSRVLRLQTTWCKSTKFACEFCGLDPLRTLVLVDIATLNCSNRDFLRIFTRAPCLFNGTYSSRKNFMNLCQKILKQLTYTFAITINYHNGILGYNLLLSQAFSVGIHLTVGFRPQLVVVSGLSVGIPLTVGFRLSRSLCLSWSLFTNSFSFHDRILAITKPFHKLFLFSR
jgi:hypothetical protein